MLIKLLACLGLVWILKDSYILSAPREFLSKKSKHLKELIYCSQCLGFWVGVFLSLYELSLNGPAQILLFIPLLTSAFCWFFDSLLDLIQESSALLEKHRKKQ